MDRKMYKDGAMPFGMHMNPGKPSAVGSLLYSLGIPVYSGGKTHNIFMDKMMSGSFRPNGLISPTAGNRPTTSVTGADQTVDFTAGTSRNRMRGGMMGLNYRLMR